MDSSLPKNPLGNKHTFRNSLNGLAICAWIYVFIMVGTGLMLLTAPYPPVSWILHTPNDSQIQWRWDIWGWVLSGPIVWLVFLLPHSYLKNDWEKQRKQFEAMQLENETEEEPEI
tara:strand:+ start:154 stop:498 length:345 start_codon:yes stop_codon:yes gene_type:complete